MCAVKCWNQQAANDEKDQGHVDRSVLHCLPDELEVIAQLTAA